jgi:CsoR family transcriptional regulator, copper-sensing transcriptional repressor
MKPMDPAAKATLLRRLRRVEGQVRGLQRMVEAEAYCIDVLHQVAAARAALAEVGRTLLGGHVERCVVDAVRSGSRRDRDRKVTELLQALGQLNGP